MSEPYDFHVMEREEPEGVDPEEVEFTEEQDAFDTLYPEEDEE